MAETVNPFTQLEAWYQTPLGRVVSDAVLSYLREQLSHSFGYHILQLGLPDQSAWLKESPITHQVLLSDDRHTQASLLSDFTDLPLASASIDVVVLPHTLEYAVCPHTLLTEVNRVLIPEGHLVIVGFNPVSLWGLTRSLTHWMGGAPWQGHFMSVSKMRHLLAETGCRVKVIKSFLFRPPVRNTWAFEQLLFLESVGRLMWPYPGGVYMLVAQRQVIKLTPIRPIWRFRNFVIGKRFSQPPIARKTGK